MNKVLSTILCVELAGVCFAARAEKEVTDGIYPHLAMRNDEGECGTGAVVPWAGSLWVITYGPHCPVGSSDKLYQIKPDLSRIVRAESVGGTHANRMIHRESNQLLIGPYAIDAAGNVRVIEPRRMPGRLTATARHTADAAGKIFTATMDNGLYEIDVKTLAVKTLVRDDNGVDGALWGRKAMAHFPYPPDWNVAIPNHLPGSHTKGMATGFGRVFVANNGEYDPRSQTDPWIPSGVLGSYDPVTRRQRTIRRCQFTEVTTRDGIYGNEHPESNPIWSLGWDAKSVILAVTTNGSAWAYYRLPKASHCYDGAHGWNTEWPRIREAGLGEGSLLATMHGTFWRFPKNFSPATPNGIRPLSTYLKVIGDFCYWKEAPNGGAIVFGCDDHAKCAFLGKRKLKADQKPNLRSTSNLWFVKPEDLTTFGPPTGEGWVWFNEDVKAGDVSDPYLWEGYAARAFSFTDAAGRPVPHELLHEGDWVRVKTLADAKGVSAHFVYGPAEPAALPPLDARHPFVDMKDDNGKTFRFPNVNGDTNVICREVVTERDLLYAGGVFYEVPAENAGGFAALRPIALADEPVKSIAVDSGLVLVNGKAMALDSLWKNGTAAEAYRLWRRDFKRLDCIKEPNPFIPFLAITGKPTDAELARKVAAMKADGYDAFLIYARSGLQYRYMGEDWLHALDTLCTEADRRGMKVWLYDEYNWPSGTCMGRVPNEKLEYRYCEWAVYREADGSLKWETKYAPLGWVNVLDDGAMARFIELTHDVYAKRLRKWFDRKLIQGIFTDEPGHPTSIHYERKPLCRFACWNGLEAEYKARTGRNFRADIEAQLNGKGSAEVWEIYSNLQGRRFRTNYFDRIERWCRKMGVLSTGHMIAEDDVGGSCRFNGNPLVALKGESLPGMDEIASRPNRNAEWLTLSVAQHAATRNGRGGLVELYALGPNDMTPARMRQMVWLEALFGIDHYLVSMQVMDHKGLVEKHGYLSPIQVGQSWHASARPLFDDAKVAARFARRFDYVRTAAVRYPQKAASRQAFAGGTRPQVRELLGAINTRQMTSDLIEEDERTNLPFVFSVEGATVREERSGRTFPSAEAAANWLRDATKGALRYVEADGSPARDLIVREYADGSSVALDVRNDGARGLWLESAGTRQLRVIPARGVDVCQAVAGGPKARFSYTLDRPNVMRLFFDSNRVARVKVEKPMNGLRLVLRTCAISYAITASGRPVDAFEAPPKNERVVRHDAEPYAFELDGKPISGVRTATSLPAEYQPLYRETEPLELAEGEHVIRLVSGESDRNYFLPAAFVAGAFATNDQTLRPLPEKLAFGTLASQGLATYAGEVTYHLANVRPLTDTIRLSTGNVFTRVKWNGADLGVRGWEPFAWKLPSTETGTLDVTIYTPVVNILGDAKRPGADWDVRMWCAPHDSECTAGLKGAWSGTNRD